MEKVFMSGPPLRVTRARTGLSSMRLRSVRVQRLPSPPQLRLKLVDSAWSWKVCACGCVPWLQVWCVGVRSGVRSWVKGDRVLLWGGRVWLGGRLVCRGVGWKEEEVTGQRVRWCRPDWCVGLRLQLVDPTLSRKVWPGKVNVARVVWSRAIHYHCSAGWAPIQVGGWRKRGRGGKARWYSVWTQIMWVRAFLIPVVTKLSHTLWDCNHKHSHGTTRQRNISREALEQEPNTSERVQKWNQKGLRVVESVLFVCLFVCWNKSWKSILCLLCWEGSKPSGSDHAVTRAEA